MNAVNPESADQQVTDGESADPAELMAMLRSMQADLAEVKDLRTELERLTQLHVEATEREAELAAALEKEKARADHLRWHYDQFNESQSYRIGNAIVRTAKIPGRVVSSLRSGRG